MKQSPTYSHEECKNCVRYDLDCDGNDLFDNTPEINQPLLDAAKGALDAGNDGDWQSARKALALAIAAAEKELK